MFRPMLIATLTLALWACSDGNGAINAEAERVIPIAVAVAENGAAAPTIRTTAMLAHKDEMRLAFKIGGVIANISVDEGAAVKAGQVLAELELAEVGSQVEQSRQLLHKAQRDLERGVRLYRDQVIPLESLQDLKTQRDIAAQALKATSFNREYAVITAPSDGVVLRKLAQASETIAPGAPVLVLGSADAGYVLKASLADRDVVQLALGDQAEVRFDALPGAALAATVTRLPAAADSRTGMFDIELALATTDPRLKSGLVARLALIPASAAPARWCTCRSPPSWKATANAPRYSSTTRPRSPSPAAMSRWPSSTASKWPSPAASTPAPRSSPMARRTWRKGRRCGWWSDEAGGKQKRGKGQGTCRGALSGDKAGSGLRPRDLQPATQMTRAALLVPCPLPPAPLFSSC
ncbi:MAG: efflux RND transporter periplasmic adaptor subunit [Rhodanobacteraceae bacterium]|nr:efflux RND transporter periplasmic adaptor subunit [Rhodanobacteraceae bacterium]